MLAMEADDPHGVIAEAIQDPVQLLVVDDLDHELRRTGKDLDRGVAERGREQLSKLAIGDDPVLRLLRRWIRLARHFVIHPRWDRPPLEWVARRRVSIQPLSEVDVATHDTVSPG